MTNDSHPRTSPRSSDDSAAAAERDPHDATGRCRDAISSRSPARVRACCWSAARASAERADARFPGFVPAGPCASASASSDIVVIGAGGWGSFTALNLRKMGAKVTLVDAYGPGNARSTSGDETRGVRSSYGDRPGAQGELWTLWAREAMKKWIAFDDEWGKRLPPQPVPRHRRSHHAHGVGQLPAAHEGLVGQEQDPVPDPQSGRRAQGVSR